MDGKLRSLAVPAAEDLTFCKAVELVLFTEVTAAEMGSIGVKVFGFVNDPAVLNDVFEVFLCDLLQGSSSNSVSVSRGIVTMERMQCRAHPLISPTLACFCMKASRGSVPKIGSFIIQKELSTPDNLINKLWH